MSKRIEINNYRIAQWVAHHAGCTYDVMRDHCAGIVDDSVLDSEGNPRIRGGLIWTSYTGSSMMIHVAGADERWMTPDMIWLGFHFPFVQHGCVELYTVVQQVDDRAIRFNLRMGFEIVLTRPRMFASGAGLILCMERERCRWLGIKPRTLKAGGLSHGR